MTPQNKRVLAFILGLCILLTGAIIAGKDLSVNCVVGACSMAFGAGLITLSALKEEHWR